MLRSKKAITQKMEQIKQLLIAVLQKMNFWEQNAKSIDELPDAPNVIPLAKIHISDNGTSKALELQKLIDASLSSAVNQITSIGEITVAGNDVTVPIATWKIANIGYSTSAPTIINVPFSATGTTRIDVFVANTSNQIVKISGNDTTGIAIRPNLPLNTVIVTEINVSESALTPVPFPLTSDEISAIQNANTPSATNPFATMDDIVAGGVSQLVDLTDVEIVSLADGQVLVWVEADGKWKNQTVAGAGTPTLQEVTDEDNTITDGDYFLALQANGFLISDLATNEQVGIGIFGIAKNDSTGLYNQQINFEAITSNGNLIIPNTNGKLTTEEYVDAEISSAVAGLLDDRGNHDASSNTFPSSGGSGTAGAILKGDLWTISVAGTLGGVAVTIGDVIRAKVDAPGSTSSNWVITENNIGYVPENSENKSNDLGDAASTTKFPVWAIIATYITNALASFKTSNFLDFTSSGQSQLDGKLNNAILNCQHTAQTFNDNTSYFFGTTTLSPTTASVPNRRFFSPLTGKIISIHVFTNSGTATSSQDVVLKLNNKTAVTTNTIGAIRYDNISTSTSFIGLNIDVALNDNLEFQIDIPTLTTNGANSLTFIQVIFQK